MTRKRTNPDFMNGVPELLILQLLSRQEMYGYELVSAIEKSTLSAISFGEGVIYPVLHGLERDRCLASDCAFFSARRFGGGSMLTTIGRRPRGRAPSPRRPGSGRAGSRARPRAAGERFARESLRNEAA